MSENAGMVVQIARRDKGNLMRGGGNETAYLAPLSGVAPVQK